MSVAWAKLSPFEKTIVVTAVLEFVLFLGVIAVPTVNVGRGYMLYWVLFGPPCVVVAPLVYRLFRYLDEERPLVQAHKARKSLSQPQRRDEA